MCDTITAVRSATASGAVLFGKNSDREYDEAQYLISVPAACHEPGSRVKLTYTEIEQAPATNSVLLSKPHWIWGAEIGANQHGLVIGNEAIFAKIEASVAPGIIGMDYLRLALERASTVDEAIHQITTLLRQHGQSGNCGFRRSLTYYNSFLLADLKSAKILETVDREWVVRPVTDVDAISNALTVETQFESFSTTLERRASDAGLLQDSAAFSFKSVFEDKAKVIGAEHRRNRAWVLLNERIGTIRAVDFFRILRDHEEGPAVNGRSGSRICAHRPENPIGQTTASWVADLTPGKIVHWVTGTAAPCSSLFKPVLFGIDLPPHGGQPGVAEDSESLWWRHEQLRRQLANHEDNAGLAFRAERDDLEIQFQSAMAKCPSVTDRSSREEALRVVEECWRLAMEFEATCYERLRRT